MSERKPYPTPMKVLIQRAKEEKDARKAQPCRMLEEPPDNGLLVPELVEVAHQVSSTIGPVWLVKASSSCSCPTVQVARGFAPKFTLAMRVMKSELALAQIVVFGVLHIFGRREEFKMWFPFLNASIFMIASENQELSMRRGIESHGSLPFGALHTGWSRD